MIAPDEDDDVLASEYVLGLLEGSDLLSAEARLAADPAFAERVEDWGARLAPMLIGSPAEPPASVWHGIQSKLPANDDAPSARADAAVRRWRMATIGASAIAASLALVLVTRPEPAPQAPPAQAAPQAVLVASLGDEKTASAVTIAVEASGGQLLVTPVRLAAEGRTPELWIIPDDGTPRSLGVIRTAAPSRVDVPTQHRAHIHS